MQFFGLFFPFSIDGVTRFFFTKKIWWANICSVLFYWRYNKLVTSGEIYLTSAKTFTTPRKDLLPQGKVSFSQRKYSLLAEIFVTYAEIFVTSAEIVATWGNIRHLSKIRVVISKMIYFREIRGNICYLRKKYLLRKYSVLQRQDSLTQNSEQEWFMFVTLG